MNAPPQYMMLSNQGGHWASSTATTHPPPYRRNVPRYDHNKRSSSSGGRNCCFRCICCCYCLLMFFIILVIALVLYFYAVYDPKIPSYNVSNFKVKAFDVQPDFSLKTAFLVTVKAENPNSGIGFIYEKDSFIDVVYEDSSLCSGNLPNFRQPPKNTTFFEVELKGQSEFGSGLQQAYQDSKKKGRIPLLVRVKAPVKVVVNEVASRPLIVFVNCSLVVDNLSPNKKIGILSTAYSFDVAF
ncbi:hypothetical protein M9H77_20138 [Catharanthus roseus]|uniref:Uncharacterized protein n=1 Tax=Catharanthus roseus TaxID=4058 RepID=A0ACC0AKN0_CATRO|nr:hypothetical protein M9H77_20138 [Catharanthus roseus]